jgi:hypothetical protein
MTTLATWHGTSEEALELVNVIARNCACTIGSSGERLQVCAPHEMLTGDQRALDGLLFARRMVERLRTEEFEVTAGGLAPASAR